MNKIKITLAASLTFMAVSIVVANPTFPPCITDTEIDPGGCKTLKCCTDACDSLCPGANNPQHTKCYEGCNALDLQ